MHVPIDVDTWEIPAAKSPITALSIANDSKTKGKTVYELCSVTITGGGACSERVETG